MESTERKKSLGITVHSFNNLGWPPTWTYRWKSFTELLWVVCVTPVIYTECSGGIKQ